MNNNTGINYLTEFLPDLDKFREMTAKFHNGELTTAEYKGFSGGYGSYAQRGGEKHMLRLRMAGGRLTKDRLRFIADAVRKYNIDLIKITTCQSIQLHNLDADSLCVLIEDAWKSDMISRGGGGDFPRNVMATPLSGVSKEETFDVLPYAEAAGQYLMQFIKTVKFPRKLKVCFSNTDDNETHATFRDMGFVANANHTFDIYIAGGLGNNPKLGVKVASNVLPKKILYYIKAMVNTFTAYGNYENRGRSRTRYLQDTLGVDGLKIAFNEKLNQIMETEQLNLTLPLPSFLDKKGTGSAPENSRIIPQKQDGLYAVYYHPIGGYLEPEKICELASAISDMEYVEIRLTPQGGLYVINCNADEAAKLLNMTACNAESLFETSTACVGASICQTGLGNSPALLQACAKAVREANLPDGALPKIRISGCPSSCGGHQIAAIGFRGAMKQTADGPKPAFAIFEGGSDKQFQEILADTGKTITVKDIPVFLVELGKMVADTGKNYHEWIKDNHSELVALTEKYTA